MLISVNWGISRLVCLESLAHTVGRPEDEHQLSAMARIAFTEGVSGGSGGVVNSINPRSAGAAAELTLVPKHPAYRWRG